MFVSANFLSINYGIDDTIAKFFVDRQPPANNLYWHEKLMYLRMEPGWLFIPLIVDLLFKAGIDKKQLLSEEFVSLMERIGHISAEEELKHISKEEALKAYINLVENNYKNISFYNNIVDFMRGGQNNPFASISTPFKALHRGDAFLFSLCALEFEESLQQKLVQYWFALISTLLLLDDAEDMEVDKSSGDENAFLESGLSKEGIDKVKGMVKENLQLISGINRIMAIKLDQKFKALTQKSHLQPILNL
jgi:hypothetical protein